MQEHVAVALEMYQTQVARSEHFEGLRSAISNVVLALGGAAATLIVFDGEVSTADRQVAGFVMLLGVYGLVAIRQHNERAKNHGRRAGEYRNLLDDLVPLAKINWVREKHPRPPTLLNRVWMVPPLLVGMFGALIILWG
jgi:hypothetical protein